MEGNGCRLRPKDPKDYKSKNSYDEQVVYMDHKYSHIPTSSINTFLNEGLYLSTT